MLNLCKIGIIIHRFQQNHHEYFAFKEEDTFVQVVKDHVAIAHYFNTTTDEFIETGIKDKSIFSIGQQAIFSY